MATTAKSRLRDLTSWRCQILVLGELPLCRFRLDALRGLGQDKLTPKVGHAVFEGSLLVDQPLPVAW